MQAVTETIEVGAVGRVSLCRLKLPEFFRNLVTIEEDSHTAVQVECNATRSFNHLREAPGSTNEGKEPLETVIAP